MAMLNKYKNMEEFKICDYQLSFTYTYHKD